MRINKERKDVVESIKFEYVKKVQKRFNMADAKLVNVLLGGHFKLSKAQTSTTEDEKVLMSEVPYA